MCDFNSISGKLIAAEVLFIAAIASLLVAAALNGSLFLVAGSPVAVGIALAAAGVALGLLIWIMVEASRCGEAACASFKQDFLQALTGIVASMTGLVVGLALILISSAVPFLGTIGMIATIAGIMTQLQYWPTLGNALSGWARCEASAAQAATVAAQVGAYVVVVVIVIFGLVGVVDAWKAGILSINGQSVPPPRG